MRATITDRRLEAIAGPPIALVESQAFWDVEHPTTVVVVGRLEPPLNSTFTYQTLARYRVGAGSWIVAAINNDSGGVSSNWPRAHRDGDTHAFVGFVGEGRIEIDYLSTGDGRKWQGPISAALYDRELSDVETFAVARSLSLSLSQG